MPALRVSVDGVPLAVVNTDGNDVLDIRISGSAIDEEMAALEFSGGSHPEGGESTHLIWINEQRIQPGQRVEVALLSTGVTSPRGQTIEELFPGDTSTTSVDFKPTAEMLANLRNRPRLREKFAFQIVSSKGDISRHETAPDDHGFAFSLVWNSFHPERARVSLHSYTIDNIESRGPMNYLFEERVHIGDVVRFQLVA
jgi:hypothetical protein